MRQFHILLCVIVGLPLGCSKDSGGGSSSVESPQYYFSKMTSLVVEVAYEPGAEPYVGNGLGTQPLWDFLKSNLVNLFQGRATVPTVTVPNSLSQMKSIPAQNKNVWSTAALLTLAASQRQGASTVSTGDFFVVFLNGYLDDGSGGANKNVIGVQIAGTTVLAIFKQVIVTSTSGDLPYVSKYVEQSTVVHEMGHALGLVNNGIPLVSPHQDAPNGAHCTNNKCAMYWQNEGAAGANQFVKTYILTGNENIFGSECLNDVKNFHP